MSKVAAVDRGSADGRMPNVSKVKLPAFGVVSQEDNASDPVPAKIRAGRY